jgi:ADP-heptose:LPS heptosyltransferase
MQALQRADHWLGRLACSLLAPLPALRRAFGAARAPAQRSVLLIKFWGIGSLQLLTPAVAAVRARHPGRELVLLTLASNRAFAEALGVFDRVLCADVSSPSWCVILARIARLVRRLRRERFAVVYDCEFFTRFSAVVTLLTGARETHGFSAPNVWRGGFHTHHVPFNRYWHVARNFRALAGGENGYQVTVSDLHAARFAPADAARVAERLRAGGVDPRRPYCVVNPNAGALSLERRWPRPMFAELARRLELPVVWIGSTSEREYTEGLRALAGKPTLDLAGELTAAELVALLAGAALVVSNDSGPMHVAAALGTPTLGLFGPETPQMYAPIGLSTRVLYRPPPCSPCINVHDNKLASCVWGFPQCLVQIPVDEVLAAARALLAAEQELVRELEPAPRVPSV